MLQAPAGSLLDGMVTEVTTAAPLLSEVLLFLTAPVQHHFASLFVIPPFCSGRKEVGCSLCNRLVGFSFPTSFVQRYLHSVTTIYFKSFAHAHIFTHKPVQVDTEDDGMLLFFYLH
jgi:hypothetical protein